VQYFSLEEGNKRPTGGRMCVEEPEKENGLGKKMGKEVFTLPIGKVSPIF